MVEGKRSSSWWLQFAALTDKNWKVLWHRKISLATFVFAPSLSVILLYVLFATVGVDKVKHSVDDQIAGVPSSLSRCIVLDGNYEEFQLRSFSAPNSSQVFQRCITVGYVPDISNSAKLIMQEVASSVDLLYGTDVLEFSSAESLSEFMWNNPGHVDLVLAFASDNFLTYEIWMNTSYTDYRAKHAFSKVDALFETHYLPGRLLTLQKSVDAAIIKLFSTQSQNAIALDYSVQLGSFTDIKSNQQSSSEAEVGGSGNTGCDEPAKKLRNQNVIGYVGSTLMATFVGISTIVVLLTLVSEKQNRLIGKLRQMGLQESAHIASWTVVFLLLAFLSSLLAVVIMKLVSLSHDMFLFKGSSFGVLFVTLYAFQVAMIGVALILAALFTKPTFIIILSSILFLGILFSTLTMNSFSLGDSFYDVDESGKCFRTSNPYSGFWAPHKASHFYEFLIFWFPWISYGRIMIEMFAATKTGKVFSFQDLGAGTHFLTMGKVYSAPSLGNTIGLMLGLFIVSLPLVWYLSQALAGRMNGRRRWNFPFHLGYWGYIAKPAAHKQGDTFAEEREKSEREGSLRVFKLSKSYKGGSALREVSLTMNNGEVFVLLGHNGAGKSTLINVLTGLTDATYGEAYFSGYGFKTEMAQIQSVCGICPQFDALWDELNAEEHLYVCAAMQGLRGKKAAEEIKRVLEAVDLVEDRKNMTTTFSGGMKRRLSVCMAVLGDRRKLIFLDEPTTGVDTMNKKRVWKLIEKLKEDKIVVLTTHNMEEADALGDKIAILHQGTLKAVGSSLFLKKEFGSGYQISLLLASAEDAPEVEAIVKRVLPGAKIVQSAAGNLRVSLNHNTALAIPKLLTELKASLPGREKIQPPASSPQYLKEWGISNTTLEEVFLRLSAQNDHQVTEEENGKIDDENLCLICGLKKAEVVTLYTSSGISVKVPNAICLACAVAEQSEVHGSASQDTELPPSDIQNLEDIGPPTATVNHSVINVENANNEIKVPAKSNASLFRSQLRAVFYKNFRLNLAEKKSFIFYCLMVLICVLLMKFLGFSSGGSGGVYYRQRSCSGRSDLLDEGFCSAEQFLDGVKDAGVSWDMLIPQQLAAASSDARVNSTPVVWYSSKGNLDLSFNQPAVRFDKMPVEDFNNVFVSGQNELQRNATVASKIQASFCPNSTTKKQNDLLFVSDFSTANATYASKFPSSGVALSVDASGTGTSAQAAFTVRYKSRSHTYEAEKVWIPIPSLTRGSCYYSGGYSNSYKNLVPLYIDANSGNRYSSAFDFTAPFLAINTISTGILQALTANNSNETSIRTSLKTYPGLRFTSSSSSSNSSESPSFTLIFAIMGLSVFFPLYVSRLVMERQSGLMQMMTIAGMKPGAYWLGNYLYDFILSVAAGIIFFIIGRVIGGSFVHADPVWSAVIIVVWAHALNGMATFMAGLFKSSRAATFSAVIGLVVSAAGCTFVNFKYKETRSMPVGAAIFPPLALSRILFLLFNESRQSEMLADIIVLLIASTAFYFVGLFVNQARASPNPFNVVLSRFQRTRRPLETAAETGKKMDSDDVFQEVKKVRSAPAGSLAIKTENLRKIFLTSSGRRPKVAVDDLTLGLEYGEIFGLLGANGAGKTTALSMLSGSLAPSAGVIEIGGRQSSKLQSNQLSICPQTDVVWKDLSVWTHFMFYSYLKGLSSAEARASIQSIAADLELNGDSFHKKASSLSGGQLRRLSFGVSLVGSPSILLMDEITTGLDPVSRTTIWNVVKKQSNTGRLILLTTHSMEEADTLCTRIGIMSHGRMKCLGAPLYLKNRYSNGYTLTIVTERETAEREGESSVVSLIQKAAPDAKLIYTWRRVHKYSIKSFDLNYLFQLLEDDKNKYHYGIREWQIEQTTLQDVFLKVSEEE